MNRVDRRIRSLRPVKAAVDPWHPIDVLLEEERQPGGGRAPVLTVFLAGAECPFTCVFCDLFRHTLDGPTPPGAIPAQLREAIGRFASDLPVGAHVKLYNASNFFDDRAVPRADDGEILALLEPFEQVVVECHPRLVARRALEFAAALRGRLQVAMGLETVHPVAAARLNKKATPADFDRAAAKLAAAGIGLRAFVLVGAPFVPAEERLDWIERSAGHAFAQGAEHVSLIPLRPGNGEMERLARSGDFAAPTLEEIEDAVDRCAELGPGVVTVDTWDLGRFAPCSACRAERLARLARFNAGGHREPRQACADCGSPTVDSSGASRISSVFCSSRTDRGRPTVFDELSQIDTATIEELSRIKEEIEVLERRLARMEEERGQVSEVVYERVKADYEARFKDLEETARPLKVEARSEFTKLRALEERLRRDLDDARLEKEELEFRHHLGEFDDEAFQERLGASDKVLGEREGRLGEIEEVKRRFVDAVRSEEELAAEAEAEVAVDREDGSPEAPEDEGGSPAEDRANHGDLEPHEDHEDRESYEDGEPHEEHEDRESYEDGEPHEEHEDRTTSTSEIPEILSPIDSPDGRTSENEATVLLKGPHLVIHRGDGFEELRLGSEPITVGRAIKNEVRFLSTSVSRHHARIVLSEEGYEVSDLGSGNGTLVNGEPVSGERRLRGGDMIQVGSEILIFREN